MAGAVPSIEELRARALREGVTPTDEDLARVQAFLTVFLPLFAGLDRAVPADTVPAALFRPECER